MKAAVFHGPQDVRIEDVPDPAVRAPDDVVLEVTRAAICGTDAAEWDHGPVLCRPGVILGHEFVGRVVDLAKTSPTLRVGTALSRELGSPAVAAAGASLIVPTSAPTTARWGSRSTADLPSM